MDPTFLFDEPTLATLADRHRDEFLAAQPCRHLVVDDFLPLEVLDRLIAEFPGPAHPGWDISGAGRTYFSKSRESAKLHMRDAADHPPFIRHMLLQLNSPPFVRFLERLTGTRGLVVDPTFNGCGMHSTGRGGRLMLHTDMNRHPDHDGKIHQVYNSILYLNRDWQDEWGGHLELWDKSPRRRVQRIAPLANRFVLFDTGTRALHGHPEPVAGPDRQRRNSLAVYYYALDRPLDDGYDHFQMDVNWFPTRDDDVRFAADWLARFRAALAEMKGRAWPFELSELHDVAKRLLPFGPSVFLFDWDELADRARFIETHLRGVVAKRPLGELRPFGVFGIADESELMQAGRMTCLVDDLGKIYYCRGPDADQLIWLGYVGRFMKCLGRTLT
jgi:hypothetical protein